MEINFLSIALGGLAFWVLGALWYSSLLFGRSWQSELGMSNEDLQKGNMPYIYGASFLLMILMSLALFFVIASHAEAERTFSHGVFHGLEIGVLVAACATGINYLYQRKSFKLFLIDAVYQVIGLGLSGGVIAVMN